MTRNSLNNNISNKRGNSCQCCCQYKEGNLTTAELESFTDLVLCMDTYPELYLCPSSFIISNDSSGTFIEIKSMSTLNGITGNFALSGYVLAQTDSNTYAVSGNLFNNSNNGASVFIYSFMGNIAINSPDDIVIEGVTTDVGTIGLDFNLKTTLLS